jgi:hypothetical protein
MKRALSWLRNIWPASADRTAQAYRDAFANPPGERVLADLAVFCGALKLGVEVVPGQPVDQARLLLAEGRRQVFLHIAEMRGLTFDEVQRLMEIT